jgi:hypothetical protein
MCVMNLLEMASSISGQKKVVRSYERGERNYGSKNTGNFLTACSVRLFTK